MRLRAPLGRTIVCAIAILASAACAGAQETVALEEQSIGAGELSTTPTPSPSPGASVEPTATPYGAMTPTMTQTPGAAPTNAVIFPEPTLMPTPSGEMTPMEIGSVRPIGPLSEMSLQGLIRLASTPARATCLRITEQARIELMKGKVDDSIRNLGRAVSIDPSAGYPYFFLGRAYLIKKNYPQSMIFLKRAEIDFGQNRPWLGETLAYEGLNYEQSGRAAAAEAAYQQALEQSPGNLMARAGYTRLYAETRPTPLPTSTGGEGGPESEPPLPPRSSPPPPPPSMPPPPAD